MKARPAMSFLSGAKNLAGRTLVKNRNEIPILLAQNCPPGSRDIALKRKSVEFGFAEHRYAQDDGKSPTLSTKAATNEAFLREEAPARAGEGEIVCM